METEVTEDMDPKGRKISQVVDPEENNLKSLLEEGAKDDFSDHLAPTGTSQDQATHTHLEEMEKILLENSFPETKEWIRQM